MGIWLIDFLSDCKVTFLTPFNQRIFDPYSSKKRLSLKRDKTGICLEPSKQETPDTF